MRTAALVTALVGVGLAPQLAAAVGVAGCGSFYQDKACREDCGSCSQPCCALEWEVGRFPRPRAHACASPHPCSLAPCRMRGSAPCSRGVCTYKLLLLQYARKTRLPAHQANT